ncbi:MAG: hypothetical protein ACYTBJ_24370, partial [Planctomycetota bacterium]
MKYQDTGLWGNQAHPKDTPQPCNFSGGMEDKKRSLQEAGTSPNRTTPRPWVTLKGELLSFKYCH